jgi:hypothetical protein
MVIQFPGTRKDNAFVTSDRDSVEQGRREVFQWMNKKGYSNSAPDRVFAIFDHGKVVREWNVVEKARGPRLQ